MNAARFDDPIAHTSALAGLVGGAISGAIAGALIGGALLATAATGGLAAPLLVGAILSGAALGAWVGEYLGSLSFFSNLSGAIAAGSPNVRINGKWAARARADAGLCSEHGSAPQKIATGSGSVYINGQPAARVDDKLTCDAFIREGSPNVRIGGGKQQVLEIEPEVSGRLHIAVMAAGIGGALLLGGWAILPGIIGGAALGYAGGEALGWVGLQAGDWLSDHVGGLPSDWQKTGVFSGQAAGGALGAKGGKAAWDRLGAESVDVIPERGQDLPNYKDNQSLISSFEIKAGDAFVNPSKFSDYIFKEGADHGKDRVFRSLSYSKEHTKELVRLYERQAAEKYQSGDYTLGKSDQYGQRINIEIELPGIGESTGKSSFIKSGWMIQPDGKITLNTPFTGFTR